MPLFLVPIIAGGATYGWLNQEEAGDYSAGSGSRQLDAAQIYQQLHAGPGTGSLTQGQDSARTLQSSFGERIAEMEALSSRMDEAWEGDAAQSAKAGAHPLKQWLSDSQGKLNESDRSLSSQVDAYNTALSRVQPLPASPPKSGFLNTITPWETDTDREIKDYNAKAQANVEAYNSYFEVSTNNGRSMPTFSTVDGEFGDVEVDGSGGGGDRTGGGIGDGGGGVGGGGVGGGGGGIGGPGGGIGGPGGGIGGPGGGIGGPGGGIGGPGGGIGGPGGGIGGPGGGIGGPGGGIGGPGGGIGGPGGGIVGGPYDPGESDDSTNVSNFNPSPRPVGPDFPGGGPGSNYGGGPGGGSVGGGSGSGGGFGGGVAPVGSFGAGAGGAAGAGMSGAGGAGASTGAAAPGGASGMAGGRAAMGGPAAAGGAAGRGMGGMPMGAMGGAGRGQGSEDEEHQTKFLVEEDGDSLFGSDELTAPPVIGE